MLEKIQQVYALYTELDEQLSLFSRNSMLQCPSGCINCCTKPDMQASVLEFLPLAYHVYMNHQTDALLEQIENGTTICTLLNTNRLIDKEGLTGCKEYQHRGMICRLFGSSAMNRSGKGLKLYTCKEVKTNQTEQFNLFELKINSDGYVPRAEEWFARLAEIDPNLAQDYFPVNEAITKALMKVAYYFDNQPTQPADIRYVG